MKSLCNKALINTMRNFIMLKKTFYGLSILTLISITAHAETTYRTDSFGNTRVTDSYGNTTTYRTDSFGNTRGSDGSNMRTDSFGNTRITDSNGNTQTCRKDSFGTTRCK